MMVSIIEAVLYSKPTAAEHQYLLRSPCHLLARGGGGGEGVRGGGEEGVTCLKSLLGMCRWSLRTSTRLESILWPNIDPILVTFGKM